LEGVQDHIVSNLHGKETPFSMWKPLIELFEHNSDQGKLALKVKLRSFKMQKNDTIPQYLTSSHNVVMNVTGSVLMFLKKTW